MIGLSLSVPYPDGKTYHLSNMFAIESNDPQKLAFDQPGDSGAVISTIEGNHPVGLLIVGNRSAPYLCYALPLQQVLDALGAVHGHEVRVKYN